MPLKTPLTAPVSVPESVPIPHPHRPLREQSGDVLLAMCIFGEARGEPEEARLAVGHVVRNRVRSPHQRYGRGWHGVMLKKWQFSCFLPGDPNLAKLLHPVEHEPAEVWERCWRAANCVYAGAAADNSGGATHYFDDSLRGCPPLWAARYVRTVKLGRLHFFRAPE
ncbi:MAG: cell wall hydrolase [Terriglobales bacterium]